MTEIDVRQRAEPVSPLPPHVPFGHRYYLAFIERAPDQWEPRIRSLATFVRRVKLTVRLFVARRIRLIRRAGRRSVIRARRLQRRAARRQRQLVRASNRTRLRLRRSVRSVTRRQRRTSQLLRRRNARLLRQSHHQVARVTHRLERNGRFGVTRLSSPRLAFDLENTADPLESSTCVVPPFDAAEFVAGAHLSRWRRFVRRLLPPTVELTGNGPCIAVDARGLPAVEVAQQLDGHTLRAVVVVDDPHVGELRNRSVNYEYVPPAPNELDAGEFWSGRVSLLQLSYGIERVVSVAEALALDAYFRGCGDELSAVEAHDDELRTKRFESLPEENRLGTT